MRIIAGTARSLPLKTIEGLETRPTTDKIKETLFNMLQNDVPGCYFLDLFAGSGQIGLEAISRGALYAVFIENNRKAAKCIEDNIAFTKFTKESRLLTTDVISGISSLEGKYTFDIIFMDPPYRQGLEEDVLRFLSKSSVLKPDTMIIVEASLDTDFSYLDELGFSVIKFKKYKTNMHVFIQQKRGITNMKKAIYPGSFDPLTFGHMDIINRASRIVDELVVGVLNNSAKNSLFSLEERVSMIEEMTKDIPNVTVASFDGLLVEFMNKIDATIIVRGLRAVTDFEYELQIAQANHVQDSNIETIFLTSDLSYSYLSSTIVKEFASYGGDISNFVPERFIERIYKKYENR